MGLPEQNMKLSSVKDGLVKGSTVLDAIIKQLVEEFGDEYEIYKEPQNQNAADDFVYEDFVDVVEKEKNEQRPIIFVRQFNVNQYDAQNEQCSRTYQTEIRFFLGESQIPNELKDEFVHRGHLCLRKIYLPSVKRDPQKNEFAPIILPVKSTRQTSVRGTDFVILYVDYKIRLVPNVLYDKFAGLELQANVSVNVRPKNRN